MHRNENIRPTGGFPRGFTLVELLVVIGIIALLISMLLPSLNKAREQARTAACLSNQRQVALAMIQYANEYRGSLPPYGHFTNASYAEDPTSYWWVLIAKYGSSATSYMGIDIMRCPTEREPRRYGTYGVNYGKTHNAPFSYSSAPPAANPLYAGSRKVTKVSHGTFLTADCVHWSGLGDVAIYNPNEFPLDMDADLDGINDTYSPTYPTVPTKTPYNHFDPRHAGNVAVCSFIDGSARTVPLRDWAQNKDRIWGP